MESYNALNTEEIDDLLIKHLDKMRKLTEEESKRIKVKTKKNNWLNRT